MGGGGSRLKCRLFYALTSLWLNVATARHHLHRIVADFLPQRRICISAVEESTKYEAELGEADRCKIVSLLVEWQEAQRPRYPRKCARCAAAFRGL